MMLTHNETSSLVIDTLLGQAYAQNTAVLDLYCEYHAQKEQSSVNMIGCLLKQVALRTPKIPDEVTNAFAESNRGRGQGLQLAGMLQLFVKVIASIDRVYICVDAVDELLPHSRLEFLGALGQIVQNAPNTRIFLTGKLDIQGGFDRHLTSGTYIIHNVANEGDAARYLSHMIDNNRDPGLMTEDLKNDIMKAILEKAPGM